MEFLELLNLGLQSPENAKMFVEIIQRAENYFGDDLPFKMQISLNTLKNWKTGKSLPILQVRKTVYNWLKSNL